MGFPCGFLQEIVLVKAALLGCTGFVLGWAGGGLLYQVIERGTGIVMETGITQVGLIFILTQAMCLLAGWIAVRRVLRMDPAAAI
jgi:putative ABC transport system permease protein